MHTTKGRHASRLGRLLVALATMLTVGLAGAGDLQARESTGGAWEQLAGVPGPVEKLFTPASGPLFAQAGLDLYRSDDGGTAWSTVMLPPAPGGSAARRQILVNPSSHQQIYATGADGLYRTVDDAASWQVIWPNDPDFPSIAAVTVSPADGDLIYLVARTQMARIIKLARSDDGGQTWTTLEQDGHEGLACTWTVHLLQAHPTDASRLFRAIECHHGLSSSLLQESRDRGGSWAVLADTGGTRPETVKDPRQQPAPAPTSVPLGRIVPLSEKERAIGTTGTLEGGQGAQPSRFYLVVTKPAQGGGMSLLQSDDDGLTWIERLSYAGGGGMTPANDSRPNVTLSSLSLDPSTPDRLYGAFHEQVKGQPATDALRTSQDGGQTWTDLGPGSPGPVADLALGIDGRNLYAASGSGVWRLALGQ